MKRTTVMTTGGERSTDGGGRKLVNGVGGCVEDNGSGGIRRVQREREKGARL